MKFNADRTSNKNNIIKFHDLLGQPFHQLIEAVPVPHWLRALIFYYRAKSFDHLVCCEFESDMSFRPNLLLTRLK